MQAEEKIRALNSLLRQQEHVSSEHGDWSPEVEKAHKLVHREIHEVGYKADLTTHILGHSYLVGRRKTCISCMSIFDREAT